MDATNVVSELRARGFCANVVSWFVWKRTAGDFREQREDKLGTPMMQLDSVLIILIGPCKGLRLPFTPSVFGIEEPSPVVAADPAAPTPAVVTATPQEHEILFVKYNEVIGERTDVPTTAFAARTSLVAGIKMASLDRLTAGSYSQKSGKGKKKKLETGSESCCGGNVSNEEIL